MASIGRMHKILGQGAMPRARKGGVLFTQSPTGPLSAILGRGIDGNSRSNRTLVTSAIRQSAKLMKNVEKRYITAESRHLTSLKPVHGTAVCSRSTSLCVPHQISPHCIVLSSNAGQIRTMMAEGDGGGADKQKKSAPLDDGSGDSTELAPLTPGEKVVVGSRLLMWTGILAFASACAYYIGRELLPGKMSPNVIFDKAFEVVKSHPEIGRKFGEPLKAYGRDHGGHREGRRNFIEHSQYTDKDDGSKRTRVRFNIEGQYGQAFVFAEVSSDMDSGEFVYVIVQDKRNGQIINLIDNRAAMTARRMAGGSKEGQEAFGNLMGGFKRS